MKRIVMIIAAALVLALGAGTSFAGAVLNGAGATFPYPLYSKWFYTYEKETGTKINYQSIGSGGGIAQVKAGTVDFGASDAPLKGEQLREAGLFQFPMVAGVVAVVDQDLFPENYNVGLLAFSNMSAFRLGLIECEKERRLIRNAGKQEGVDAAVTFARDEVLRKSIWAGCVPRFAPRHGAFV